MPSLKDLRNRISSVKATQKITKAMQMVAAAKLRRAQVGGRGRAALCRAHGSVLGQSRRRRLGQAAPPLLAGNGKDEVHLLVVATAERGLCGAFNSSIVRLAREQSPRCMAQGKTVKILCVGKKGYDQLRRQFEKQIVELIELRGVKHDRLRQRRRDRQEGHRHVRRRRVRRRTLFFSRFKSVIAQIPTAQQLIPAQIPRMRTRAGRRPAGRLRI